MLGAFFPQSIGCANWGNIMGGLCSGHGQCLHTVTKSRLTSSIPESFCHCNPNWNGKGHFISLENLDCSSHIPTLFFFHVVMVILQSYTLYVAIKKSIEFFLAEKNGIRCKLDNSFLNIFRSSWNRHPGFRGSFVAIFGCMFGIYVGINQLCNIYVGDTIESTTIYILYLILYWSVSTYYTAQFVKISTTLVSTSQNERDKIQLAQRTCISPMIILGCVLIFQIGPTWAVGFTQNVNTEHLLTFIWALNWVILYGIMATSLIKTNSLVAMVFEEEHKQSFLERIQRYDVAKGLRTFVKQIRFNFILLTIIYGLIVFWPWFRTRVTYVLPVLMSLAALSWARGIGNLSTAGGMLSDDSISIFIRLVNDPEGYAFFQAFLAKEFSSENLHFWTSVEEYRELVLTFSEKYKLDVSLAPASQIDRKSITDLAIPEHTQDPELEMEHPILVSAKNIYLSFVAPEMVNIPDTIRQKLETWFRKLNSKDESERMLASNFDILSELFIEAQVEIFNLIRSDPLHRFQKTKDFIKLKDKWDKEDLVVSHSRGSKNGSRNSKDFGSGRNLLGPRLSSTPDLNELSKLKTPPALEKDPDSTPSPLTYNDEPSCVLELNSHPGECEELSQVARTPQSVVGQVFNYQTQV